MDKLQSITSMIYEIRGQKVMLDSDLAKLYGVSTHRLNEGVKRNIKRFPPEFMFLMLYIEKNDKRENEIIIALNNLICAEGFNTPPLGLNLTHNNAVKAGCTQPCQG